MPKPRSRHKYCGVCRGHYEDYKEHTESELHLTYLKNSRYQEMIVQLSSHYQQMVCRRDRKEDNVASKGSVGNMIDLTADEVKAVPELVLVDTTSTSKSVLP